MKKQQPEQTDVRDRNDRWGIDEREGTEEVGWDV